MDLTGFVEGDDLEHNAKFGEDCMQHINSDWVDHVLDHRSQNMILSSLGLL